MTALASEAVTLRAQWALHGKADDGEGYRVLAHSTGDLSGEHFADALGRFQLGAMETLPQVSVSYAHHGTRPGTSYLALAICRFADDSRPFADEVLPFDVHGRPTAFTSYFCLPYRRLAAKAVSYHALYEGLRGITLPTENGAPRTLAVTAPAITIPSVDDLALRVAALLLTDRPVCVLGADQTTMDERLRFIDAVMGLLPYGFRTRMTAATWTRPTYRDHRFRLFFSSAPRSGAQPDHLVTWGEADTVGIPDGEAAEYFDWLIDKVNPLTVLPRLTAEIGFGPKAALRALESVDNVRPPSASRPGVPAGPAGLAGAADRLVARLPPEVAIAAAATPGPAPRAVTGDLAEQALAKCAAFAAQPNLKRLGLEVSYLRRFADTATLTDGDRARYRDLIAGYGLLRPDAAVEKLQGRLYDALLALAFGTPVGYDGYCQLEDCLPVAPGEPLPAELLAAIERGGPPDVFAAGIVHWQQRHADEKRLNKWLGSDQLDPVAMISQLAIDWARPPHARMLCDLTLDYLNKLKTHYEPLKVRAALRQHGYLASALSRRHPDKDQYQVSALHQFLRAAYPSGIDRPGIIQILTGTPRPPTPALLGAVLTHLARPGDWQLARDAYAYGALSLMRVDAATSARLMERAPAMDAAAVRDPAGVAGVSGRPG